MLTPLRKKGDFSKVFEQGLKFSSRYLVLYARPNGLSFSRLGLSVGKKTGIAVARNRIKRRLREALRTNLQGRQLFYDFVIVARMYAVEAKFSVLNNAIAKCIAELADEKNINSVSQNI